MAVIKSLIIESSKRIKKQTEVLADYNMDDEFFSIWSYKDHDIHRSGTCKQNMQFGKEVAKELRDALNIFLHDM